MSLAKALVWAVAVARRSLAFQQWSSGPRSVLLMAPQERVLAVDSRGSARNTTVGYEVTLQYPDAIFNGLQVRCTVRSLVQIDIFAIVRPGDSCPVFKWYTYVFRALSCSSVLELRFETFRVRGRMWAALVPGIYLTVVSLIQWKRLLSRNDHRSLDRVLQRWRSGPCEYKYSQY